MRALQTAATGMMAQELNVQVISDNIANLRTTGYKRQQAHFQDLLYHHLRRAGASTSDQGTQVPAGISLGSGVKAASTARTMAQGNLTATEKEFDVAIRGDGFFRIRLPDGRTAYTRDGSFDLDSQGQRGRIRLVRFENPQLLRNEGTNLFSSAAAQPAGNTSRVQAGAIERSNVQPVVEMSRLIEVNRNYTSVAGMVQRMDELRRTAISRLADNA